VTFVSLELAIEQFLDRRLAAAHRGGVPRRAAGPCDGRVPGENLPWWSTSGLLTYADSRARRFEL